MNNNLENVIILLVAESIGINVCAVMTCTPLSGFPRWDSLAALSLLTSLEDEFQTSIDPASLFACDSVHDIVKLINAKQET